jgi:hypothetical protein
MAGKLYELDFNQEISKNKLLKTLKKDARAII